MTHESMTIHKALAELKILDSRITDAMSSGGTFVKNKKHSADNIDGKSLDKVESAIRGKYDKITSLIARRKAIKKAVALSNAKTIVTVCGKEFTVAEAIEYKNSGILFEELLRNQMTKELNKADQTATMFNEDQLPDRCDNFIQSLYGSKDAKSNGAAALADRERFLEQNTLDVYDPLDVRKKVEELDEYISNFKAEVDAALSVSNALTVIEIEY